MMSNDLNPSLTKYQQSLLVVEDSDVDFEALMRALQKSSYSCQIYRVEDGDEALDFLWHREKYADPTKAPRPHLILLDLNLPGTDGREVICQVKNHPSLKLIPIVVFTTSSSPQDIECCYRDGVNSYILKPIKTSVFQESVHNIIFYWLNCAILPD